MISISLKSTQQPVAISAADSVGLSLYAASPGKAMWCVTVVQDHSRSLKFVPIESPCATSY